MLVGQGDPLAVSYLRNRGFPQAPAQIVGTSGGFSWSDAGIGAGATLGLVLLLAGAGRRTRRHPPQPQAARRKRVSQGRVGALPLVAETRPFGASSRSGPVYLERGMKLIAPDVSSTAQRMSEIESNCFSRA